MTAELTKIRTVRPTVWALSLTPLICVCLGYPVSLSLRSDSDPLFATFYSISLGQLALVVFGVAVVGGEYSSGTITASLTAVPRRGLFYAAKLAAGLLLAAVTALISVIATFFAAQQALGPHHVSLLTPATRQAVVGAVLYLIFICAVAMGLAAVTRGTARALGSSSAESLESVNRAYRDR